MIKPALLESKRAYYTLLLDRRTVGYSTNGDIDVEAFQKGDLLVNIKFCVSDICWRVREDLKENFT